MISTTGMKLKIILLENNLIRPPLKGRTKLTKLF